MPNERHSTTLLLALMFNRMVLEMHGIELVIPSISLLSHIDFASQYTALLSILDTLGNRCREVLVIVGTLDKLRFI
jgi:hypothetical protein